MRSFAVLIVLVFLTVPLHAQTYDQGVYESESITYVSTSGTWATGTSLGASWLQSSAVGSSRDFQVDGTAMVINRLMRTANGHTMSVCFNGGSCQTISNGNSSLTAQYWSSVVVPFPSNSGFTVTITLTAGTVTLDYFIVLDGAGGGIPTAVPTATAVPTSTPASTTTPQPTSTPAPTATPLLYVWAIDPSKRYGDSEGQISAFDYSASAADVHLANILTFLVISVWGFFLFSVFVLVKYKVEEK